jgi:hypothetical protein
MSFIFLATPYAAQYFIRNNFSQTELGFVVLTDAAENACLLAHGKHFVWKIEGKTAEYCSNFFNYIFKALSDVSRGVFHHYVHKPMKILYSGMCTFL